MGEVNRSNRQVPASIATQSIAKQGRPGEAKKAKNPFAGKKMTWFPKMVLKMFSGVVSFFGISGQNGKAGQAKNGVRKTFSGGEEKTTTDSANRALNETPEKAVQDRLVKAGEPDPDFGKKLELAAELSVQGIVLEPEAFSELMKIQSAFAEPVENVPGGSEKSKEPVRLFGASLKFVEGRIAKRKTISPNMEVNLKVHHNEIHQALEGNPLREIFFDGPDYASLLNRDPEKVTNEKILKKFQVLEKQNSEAERKIESWMSGMDPSTRAAFKESPHFQSFLRSLDLDDNNISTTKLSQAILSYMKEVGASDRDMLRMLCLANNVQSTPENLDRYIEEKGVQLIQKGVHNLKGSDIHEGFDKWKNDAYVKRGITSENMRHVHDFFGEHPELESFQTYFVEKVRTGKVDLSSPDFTLTREVVIAANFHAVARTGFLSNVNKQLSQKLKEANRTQSAGEMGTSIKELSEGERIDQCKGMMTQFKGLGVDTRGIDVDGLIEGQRVITQADIDVFNSVELATVFTEAKLASNLGDEALIEKLKQPQEEA